MSISAETARAQYTLTSTGQTLAVAWYFLAAADLKVVKTNPTTFADTTLVLTTDYSVTGAGVEAGGSITLEVAAGAIGDIITIYRNGGLVQPAEYPSTGQFPSATTEQSQDRLTMLVQQLRIELDRCLRVPISNAAVTAFTRAQRAGKYLGFDANGAVVFNEDAGTPTYILYDLTLGNYFIGGGNSAMTGGHNVGLGEDALVLHTTGGDNVAIGWKALANQVTGSNNTAVGSGALENNEGVYDNTAFGFHALNKNTTGTNNVACGDEALYLNTTGSGNTAVGLEALRVATTADNNTACGIQALGNITTGGNNTGVGLQAGKTLTTGANNTAVGYLAMGFAVSGGAGNCVAVGFQALEQTTGSGNVGVGKDALVGNTTGTSNTAIGDSAGAAQAACSTCTFVGKDADASVAALSNSTAIGHGASVSKSNQLVFGNASVTAWKFPNVAEYASNALALAGGLAAGEIYRTGDALMIVH